MAARFTRLHIAGFKSFADPVSVDILPGLTGIVGPNGCGKSNVVEALRWVMGESSARSLRGGELDDLIFAGTTSRPARSFAEVTVTLEGVESPGLPLLTGQTEVQITRRAERGAGSEYRINGKTARARDVQILFADIASGARSSAMVSQGRVARLVSAKPEERRVLLEEAAGITGLHARRHEAELKLRATENNLLRAEDLCQQLSSRLENLSGQCEEATRYREISAHLRKAETDLLTVTYARAHNIAENARTAVSKARFALTRQQEVTETAVLTEYELTQRLPALRAEVDTTRTALERCRVMAESTTREKEKATAQAQASAGRLHQQQADADAARVRAEDAATTLTQLIAEQKAAEISLSTLPGRITETENAYHTQTHRLSETEQTLSALNDTLYKAGLNRDRAQEQLEQSQVQHNRNTEAFSRVQAETLSVKNDLPSEEALTEAKNRITHCATERDNARRTLRQAESSRSDAQLALSIAQNNAENARKTQQETLAALARARAGLNTLVQNYTRLEHNYTSTQKSLLSQDVLEALRTEAASATHAHQTAQNTAETCQQSRQQTTDALTEASRIAQTNTLQHKTAQDACLTAEATLLQARQEESALRHKSEQTRRTVIADEVLNDIRQKRSTLETELTTLSETLKEREAAHSTLSATQRSATAQRDALRAELSRLQAQAEGLTQPADQDYATTHEPVSELMTIPEAYEQALAAALAKGLDAPLAGDTPQGWRAYKTHRSAPALPANVTALADYIKAPDVIETLLSFIGLVADTQTGDALQGQLLPGQCLVSLQGDLWRWDGFYTRADKQNQAARHLIRQRVLKETEQRIGEIKQELETAEHTLTTALEALHAHEQQVAAFQTRRAATEQALQLARTQEATTERAYISAQTQLELLTTQLNAAVQTREAAEALLSDKKNAEQALPSPEAAQQALKDAQQRNQAAQEAEQAARRALQAAEEKRRTATAALTLKENQHSAALARLESMQPETERLKQAVAAETARVKELEDQSASTSNLSFFEEAFSTAQQQCTETEAAFQAARHAVTNAETAYENAVAAGQQLEQRAITLRSKLETLRAQHTLLQAETEKSTYQLEAAQKVLNEAVAAIPSSAADNMTALQQLKAHLLTETEQLRETRTALQVEQTTLTSRQSTLSVSIEDWRTRADTTQTELEQCAERLKLAQQEYQDAAELPAETERQEQKLIAERDKAEALFTQAQGYYERAEKGLAEAATLRRQSEAALAEHREALLKAEAKNEQAQAAIAALPAERPPSTTTLAREDLTEASETALRRKIARLTREREDMGPVNLRAELETEEISTQLETLTTEISDLRSAIASLRGSIGSLNKTGRERLLATFAQIDQHFQALFSRMFEGGKAHLGFVGSDDPLESGLEIYAQPPGKKLSTLSLLSGGEQALTALSLVFAVFRCNPAPLCVLDEVDAPLDDANVERFSRLMGDMVTEAQTRFLVVTHHQLTMAHMDHLFGVTMQERGVSRVLSVDLTQLIQQQSA